MARRVWVVIEGSMASLWSRVMTGITAFREAFMDADIMQSDGYEDWDARRLRYSLLWAYFQGNAYRDIHKWTPRMRVEYGLYKYIRSIYNPTYELVTFHKGHVWGGAIDPMAGDGNERPSALPIIMDSENPALRQAIAQIWQWSNWQKQKDLVPQMGACLGDVALQVVDDTVRGRVYIRWVHPGDIKEITLDEFSNVKGYVIEREVPDPLDSSVGSRQDGRLQRMVTYRETAERDEENVVYATYRNGTPYVWNGAAATWSVPYGFVPLVLIQHNNVGMDWGWSELFPKLALFREIDDQASKLNDQIRKVIDPVWFFSGVKRADGTIKPTETAATTDRPEPGREELPAIYGPAQATAMPLVAPLQIADAVNNIINMQHALEGSYPELILIQKQKEELSGRALRILREPAAKKVQERRVGYDDALRRIQQMAVSIGGFRGYEGFAGFDLDSFAARKIEHEIGQRPVFAADPVDQYEERTTQWGAVKAATDAGAPLIVAMRSAGFDEEQVAEVEGSAEFQERQTMRQMALSANRQEA